MLMRLASRVLMNEQLNVNSDILLFSTIIYLRHQNACLTLCDPLIS